MGRSGSRISVRYLDVIDQNAVEAADGIVDNLRAGLLVFQIGKVSVPRRRSIEIDDKALTIALVAGLDMVADLDGENIRQRGFKRDHLAMITQPSSSRSGCRHSEPIEPFCRNTKR